MSLSTPETGQTVFAETCLALNMLAKLRNIMNVDFIASKHVDVMGKYNCNICLRQCNKTEYLLISTGHKNYLHV